MTEPKRPAHVPEGVRWGYVTLGTGELVEAWYDEHDSYVCVVDPEHPGNPFVWRYAMRWEPSSQWTVDQCRRLYEAEGTGYVELGEEHENTDRTHQDSGPSGIDWEAWRRELFARALGGLASRITSWHPDDLRRQAQGAEFLDRRRTCGLPRGGAMSYENACFYEWREDCAVWADVDYAKAGYAKLGLRLPVDVRERLQKQAEARGVSVGKWVAELCAKVDS